MEKQVCTLYAGTKGFLDSLSLTEVKKFEETLYSALDAESTILESIRTSGKLEDDTKKSLEMIINAVKSEFAA
jgi:F-type H+-transporting ATPase subunit alpha